MNRPPLDLARLPKAELHCHVDGIVDPGLLRALRRPGEELALSPEQLEAAYPVNDFDSFVRWMQTAEPLEGSLDFFGRLLALHIGRLKAQNVVYAEIMLGSSELPRSPQDWDAFIKFRDEISQLEDGQIQVEFLAAFSRHRPPEAVERLADLYIELHQAGLIAGVAVAGPEIGHPIRPFAGSLARLREAGLGIEIHAGEWAGPESVWDALDHGRPDRIGHGVAVFADPRLLERVLRDRIHIEMCPTSNVKTGSVPRMEAHPLGQAKELRLNFSINTDDPGPFECTLEMEYAVAAGRFGFNEADFEQVLANALGARFGRSRPLPPLARRPQERAA